MGSLRRNIGMKGAPSRPASGWFRRIFGRGKPPVAAASPTRVPTAERLLKPGDRIGNFRVISGPIGRGSYGHVYLAHGVGGLSRACVALKVADGAEENFLDEEAQLMREITRLGVNVVVRWKPPRGRSNGPALIGHHQLPDGRSLDYLVMEYVGGGNLQHILDTLPEHRLRQPDALAIVSDVAAGLSILHAHGILHHDIKPENILLRRPLHPIGSIKPDPVLIDFGAGFKASDLGKIALGTDGYTAPERYAGVHHLPASDIYSLGQVLGTLLGGPDQVVPVGVRRLIERMTAHDPGARPSAADVASTAAQLRRFDRSQPPVLRRPLTPREKLVGALSPAMIGLILLGAAAQPMVAKDIMVSLANEPRAIVESVIDSVGAADLVGPTVTPISWPSATPTEAAPVAVVVGQASPAPPAPSATSTATSTTVAPRSAGTALTGGGRAAVALDGTATVTPSLEPPLGPDATSSAELGRIQLTGPSTATPVLSPVAGSPTRTPTDGATEQAPTLSPQPSITATIDQPGTATTNPDGSNALPSNILLSPNPRNDSAPDTPTATRRPVISSPTPTSTPTSTPVFTPEPPTVFEAPTIVIVPTPEPTATDIRPSATPTVLLPTATFTPTVLLPTATFTPTSVLPTATLTPTVLLPTATFTPTSVLPTATFTPTVVVRTATFTPTVVVPTATPTSTDVFPTATPTATQVPPTATPTIVPTETAEVPVITPTATDVPPAVTPAAPDVFAPAQ